jgi:Svf1-like C-terminal lipocalin-like domain
MMEYTTPASYGSTVVNVGGLVRDGEIICAGSSNSAEHTETKADTVNDWPEPTAVKFNWSGKTKDGKEVTAELAGPLGDRLDRVDIMAEVPGFVKNIVAAAVGTKPYIYQACARQPADRELSKLIRILVLRERQIDPQDQDRRYRGARDGHYVFRGNLHLLVTG